MKAAIVRAAGQAPVYGDFEAPAAGDGEVLINVSAAALSQVVRGRASGSHYSSAGQFPFVVGVDGVGRTEDGERVYFSLPRAPYGAMAERTVVRRTQCLALPDALDDVTAAAIANPGMSSWAALTERAKLKRGETVLINGATGIAGSLAVQIAKHLGAGKVIATGRSLEALRQTTALGADSTIALTQDDAALEKSFKSVFAEGVDVVLDYLWGPSAQSALIAASKARPEARALRFVQVGGASGADITLPSAVLRASAMELMGSGIGSIPFERLLAAVDGVLQAAAPAGFKIATNAVLLAQVEAMWSADVSGQRTVFIP
jgi:NADPH:quinone reductase-like Zn-dependent oxidoreductase